MIQTRNGQDAQTELRRRAHAKLDDLLDKARLQQANGAGYLQLNFTKGNIRGKTALTLTLTEVDED